MTTDVTTALDRSADEQPYPIAERTRWCAATLFLLGGGLELASFLLDPADGTSHDRVNYWLAHPTAAQLSQSAGLLAVPCMIGTFWFAYLLLRRQSRRLSAVVVSLLTVAMVGLATVQGIEIAAYWAAEGGHINAAVGILDSADPGIAGVIGFLMFLPTAIVGNGLAAIAMWRSRYVPRIVVGVVIAFTLLDFVAQLGVVSHSVDMVTGLLLAWAVLTRYTRKPRTASAVAAD